MKKLLLLTLLATPAFADEPQVAQVTASQQGDTWRFDVTILHPDTGWDHYADGWEVVDANGNRLGYRELLHPHVNEQPFTRSQSGIVIPAGTTEVYIRTRDNVTGWYTTLTPVPLPDA